MMICHRIISVVVLSLIATSGIWAQPDLERIREEAKNSFQTPDAKNLAKAKATWPSSQQQIDAEEQRQDAVIKRGGQAVEDLIADYETKADLVGTPISHYLAGRLLGATGRLDQARTYFERSTDIDKYFYWGYHGLGTYYAMRNMPEPAARQYRKAIDLNPGYSKAIRGLAICKLKMGRVEEGEQLLRNILVKAPNDLPTWRALSQLLISESRYTDAIDVCNQILRRDAQDQDTRRRLAMAYSRTDQMDKAISMYQNMLTSNPKDVDSAVALAEIQKRLGNNHTAASYLQKAVDNLPLKSRYNRDALEEAISLLRQGPAKVTTSTKAKSPEEWIEILLNSVEPERRRHAVRVLAASPRRLRAIDQAMFKALNDKDAVVKTVAIKAIGKWFGEVDMLGDPGLVRIMGILVRQPNRLVRGMAAEVLGRAEHSRAVVPLIRAIAAEPEPYVFRELHRSLNRLTFAYIAVGTDEKLTPQYMQSLKQKWADWYAKNEILYRKYEEEVGSDK